MKSNFRKKVPLWLLDLPPGDYTLQEICKKCQYIPSKRNFMKKSNFNYSNVYARLNILEVEKSPSAKGSIYHWKGAEFYEEKFKEANLSNVKNFKHSVPAWLQELPEGMYSLKDICALCNQKYNNVYFYFIKKMKLKPTFLEQGQIFVRYYEWLGVDAHEKK